MKSEVIASNSKVVGIAGGDASPASDPTVSVNQLLSNNTDNLNKDNKQLSLTNKRTSPQSFEKLPENCSLVVTYNRFKKHKSDNAKSYQSKIQASRSELSKQKFKQRMYISASCSAQKIMVFDIRNSKIESAETKPSHCKSWTCPGCAPYNVLRVRRLIEQVALLNNLDYFFTFTLDPKKIPEEFKDNTHKYITLLFNKLILYLKRECKFSTPLKYFWVMEYQKNGNAHMHGMWNQFVDVNKVRAIWISIGGGKIMYLTKPENILKTARYVCKYLAKALDSEDSQFYYFQKRYSISQNCVRSKSVTITSSVDSWKDLVYRSYPSIRDDLSKLIDFEDKDPSFSFNFYEPKKET